MQIKMLIFSMAAAALLMVTLPASADEARPYHGLSDQERQEVRERWDEMSAEERAAHREAMQERRGGMTPEERAAHRQMMRDRHADDPQEGAYGKRKGYGREKSNDKKD